MRTKATKVADESDGWWSWVAWFRHKTRFHPKHTNLDCHFDAKFCVVKETIDAFAPKAKLRATPPAHRLRLVYSVILWRSRRLARRAGLTFSETPHCHGWAWHPDGFFATLRMTILMATVLLNTLQTELRRRLADPRSSMVTTIRRHAFPRIHLLMNPLVVKRFRDWLRWMCSPI